MDKVLNYEFTKADDLQSVYSINEVKNKPNKVYSFFVQSSAEVLYIINDDGTVYGLISIGDMYRYYRNEEEKLPINLKFSYVQDASDYEGAETFFSKVDTIHEIPVIQNNLLLGIIRKNKYNVLISRETLKQRLRTERRGRWQREKLRQFDQAVSMKVFYYNLPQRERVSEQLRTALDHRRKNLNISSGVECLKKMSKDEQKKFIGKNYYEGYVEDFLRDYENLKVYQKNGISRLGECCNESFHIINGYRQISNRPKAAKKRIWMFGPCTVFGSYVKDDETIEYYLQNCLLRNGYDNYEVINVGDKEEVCSALFTEKMSSDDIAIVVTNLIDLYNRWGEIESKSVYEILGSQYKGDLSVLCMELEQPLECMLDTPAHCNYLMNEKIAEKIFVDLCPCLRVDRSYVTLPVALQEYFVSWDVLEYFECYMERYSLTKEVGKKAGAIVMNCNPFTLGHRYLIEEACKYVDILYVFVVEEDRSYFRFKDRIEMVIQGTKDLKKVHVVPSGKYMISKETFAQYFEKDQIVVQVDDMDYDVHIFGEIVADMLGITCRFVGEEPFDAVTKKYNETMKRILPEYGIKLVEIPRKVQDGVCISASKVRQYIEQGKEQNAYMLVPESTKRYLDKMRTHNLR